MTLFTYVNEVNPNLICCVCHSPFLNPVVTTTCFHTFCRGCIERSLEQQACCPVDRSPLKREELRPENLLLRNMVDELLVECSNKALGCKAECQRQLLELHRRELCLYALIPCSKAGCDQLVMRKDTGRHNEICEARDNVCELCGVSVKSADLKDVACPSCSEEMKRPELEAHSARCPKASVKCEQCHRGCFWSGERQDRPSHTQSCPFESLRGFFDVVDRRFDSLRSENITLRQRLDSTESTIRSLQIDLLKIRTSLGRWWAPGDDIRNIVNFAAEANNGSTSTTEASSGFEIPRWRTTNPLSPILSFSPEASPISSTHEVPDTFSFSSTPNSNAAFSDPSFLAPYFPPPSVNSSTHSVESDAPGPVPPSSSSAQPQMDPILARHTHSHFPFAATRPSLAFPPPPIRFPDVTNPRTSASNSAPPNASSINNSVAGGTPSGTHAHASSSRVSPLDNSSTVEAALSALQKSVTNVSTALDALARRTDVALTTENLRMNEEVGALRAIVHGLRMQVHALLSDRNGGGVGGWAGLGSGSMTTTTTTYLNHPPPPTHVPLIINSTSTTSTTKL